MEINCHDDEGNKVVVAATGKWREKSKGHDKLDSDHKLDNGGDMYRVQPTWTATTRGQNAVQGYLQQAYIHLAYSLAKHSQTAVRTCAHCPYPVPAIPSSAPVPGSVCTAVASSTLPIHGCVGPGSLVAWVPIILLSIRHPAP